MELLISRPNCAILPSVVIKLCEDGRADVLVSGIDLGQGLRTVAAQFAAGEHTMIPTPTAVANALFDALGIRIVAMPITAKKVPAAIRARKTEG